MKSLPSSIDPKRLPALEQLRVHCERGGPSLLDRVYAEAQGMYTALKHEGIEHKIQPPVSRDVTAEVAAKLATPHDLL